MKSKSVTTIIILALVCLMVVTFEKANGQVHKRAPKHRPTTKREATKVEQSESDEEAEIKRQMAELAKLPPEQLVKLRATIDLLERVTRKARLAGIPKYFLSEDDFGEGGRVEPAVRECLDFLRDGIMRRAVQASFQALVDAWNLDHAEKSGVVSDSVLHIIDRYKLEGNSLYLMTRRVLDIAAVSAAVAAEVFDMLDRSTSKSP